MRTPQFLFYRGSTPTLELALPLTLTAEDAAFLTFWQSGRTMLEYAMGASPALTGQGSLTLSPEDPGLLLLHMTQADSLRLQAGDCELQLRVRTADGAETFAPLTGRVGETRKEGVI